METIYSNNSRTTTLIAPAAGGNINMVLRRRLEEATTTTTASATMPTPAVSASVTPSTSALNVAPTIKIYSAPSSPASSPSSPAMISNQNQVLGGHHQQQQRTSTTSPLPSSTPASGVLLRNGQQFPHHQPIANTNSPFNNSNNNAAFYSPIKSVATTMYHPQQSNLDATNSSTPSSTTSNILGDNVLHTIRERLRSPGGVGELHLPAMDLRCAAAKPLHVIKERYLVSSHRYQMSAAAAAKTPASYRHLIDLTSSHLRCTDVYTEQQYLCKIINEPLHKVQRAYFQLLQLDAENCQSSIYGHSLIRGVHDIVPLNDQRTYVIIAPPPKTQEAEDNEDDEESENCEQQSCQGNGNGNGVDYVYEDLHTYIRNKRRLCEAEARALFHQICQTVQVCHRNGVILRDLKLKRFYFIDEARTKLQYESLEGSMILDDPNDDTLRDKIGCPLYTAPELLCPNTTYRGKPADMWSLGVLLYTMLIGQYPFYEKGNCSLITVIRHCQVQIPPNMLTRSVRWLLLSLLRRNHEERMQAEHIFLTPWLREQRPYYMYIPANVCIPKQDDDEENYLDEDEDEEEAEHDLGIEEEEEEQIQQFISNEKTEENSIETTTMGEEGAPTTIARSSSSSNGHSNSNNTSEPLDYTCATLATAITTQTATNIPITNSNNNSNVSTTIVDISLETDVDMD